MEIGDNLYLEYTLLYNKAIHKKWGSYFSLSFLEMIKYEQGYYKQIEHIQSNFFFFLRKEYN